VKTSCDDDTGAIAPAEREAYEELQCYTLSHGGHEFVHQHAVDAWAAQHADERTRPIGLTFALVAPATTPVPERQAVAGSDATSRVRGRAAECLSWEKRRVG
jgi:hypothetical protein